MAGTPETRLKLPGSRRIKLGRDFARARTQGKRITVGCLIANWAPAPDATTSRLGVITSKKIGGAVVRNRARRLMRESFRLHQHELAQPVDLILVSRSSIVGKGFAEVQNDFLEALRRGGLLKNSQ
jgi:ribonuclease P protein component